MCLRINKNFINREEATEYKNSPKVANKNIVVYKILRKIHNRHTNRISYVSPHRGEPYVPGRNKKVKSFSFIIKNAFISNKKPYVIMINRGLHAFTTIEEAKNNQVYEVDIIVKCVIPKGTPYFKDTENNEIASLELSMPNKF